jgi:hypothetical protein
MSGKLILRAAEGLGNQLFMYANAFALSKDINFELLIDDESGYFKNKNIRPFQLDNFSISSPKCDDNYKFNTYSKDFKRKILIKLDNFRNKKKFIIEKIDNYKKTQFYEHNKNNLSNLVYIEGHFESEKYFIKYKDKLLKEFKLKNEKNFQRNKYYDLIKRNENIISICIRQNRFSERKGNEFNELSKIKSEEFTKKTIKYIYRAIDFIDKSINNPQYLIWSNDLKGLKEYFPEKKFIFVDNIENKSLTDFFLLLNCKNFIVGPTSFHWWPAWLNDQKKSLILRPKDIDISNNKNFWPDSWLSI